MAINTRLEAGSSMGLTREGRSRPYFVAHRPGGAPSSSDILGGGGRVPDPGTKLERSTLAPADPTSGETLPPPAVTIQPTAFPPSGYEKTPGVPDHSGALGARMKTEPLTDAEIADIRSAAELGEAQREAVVKDIQALPRPPKPKSGEL